MLCCTVLLCCRTETDFFKEGFELQPLLEEHRGHADWGAFASRLLDGDGGGGGDGDGGGLFQWPRHGGHDDQGRRTTAGGG